jgi:acetyl esterase/lipase
VNNPSRQPSVLPFPGAPDAIELRHLRSFVAVAEELNFGRAAARLYLSQPSLSRHVRTLERLAGCDLLRRSTHQVELTLAGEALLEPARTLLRDLDHAIHRAKSIDSSLARHTATLWGKVGVAMNASDLRELRAATEQVQEEFDLPPDITVRSANAGGVPALELRPPHAHSGTVLHLHGGGYVAGSAFGYRPLAGALAAAANATVVVPDYRLAPEHPFPAALTDSVNAYLALLESGVPAEQLVCTGDSAGATLVLSLLLTLAHDELPLPACAVLMCPALDLSGGAFEKWATGDEIATALRYSELYLQGHPADDPLVNPLLAELAGLPPMLVQTATGDPFHKQARELALRARNHGVHARLETFPVDTHAFQLFWSFLPEAADAIHQAGEFIRHAAVDAA